MDETIYAMSSGSGRAGVAVIRISGPHSKDLLLRLCEGDIVPRRAHLKSIVHPLNGDLLDQALVLWFPAPGSFTGEDVVELHIHGGGAVIAAVMEAVGSVGGLRMAEAGEFTRRAFYNGKLDLTGIEAISDLVAAETEQQRRQALAQMHGGLSDRLNRWRDRLIHILAYVEAGIDFSDEEDVGVDVNKNMALKILDLKNQVSDHLNDQRAGERLRDGLQVVIAGPANAGKSSLLNGLAKRDVAIVSEQAGTTRDVIEVHLDLNGFPVTVSDTAGLRDCGDEIEEEGVRRAREKMETADVILWTTDGTIEEAPFSFPIDSDQSLIRLRNKCDIDSGRVCPGLDEDDCPVLVISAKTGAGFDRLVDSITDIAMATQSGGEKAIITRARHREALVQIVNVLSKVLDAPELADELIAENLRICVRELGRLTGRVDVEDLLDVIFNDFCVGK